MVIELGGVKFGLKSYTIFQNQTSVYGGFDLKLQVCFQINRKKFSNILDCDKLGSHLILLSLVRFQIESNSNQSYYYNY